MIRTDDVVPEEVSRLDIDAIEEHEMVLRLKTTEEHLRPGGTVSGPTLMMMADTATYMLLLSEIGPVALAVTTSLTIHFLEKPEAGDLVAKASMLRRGKRSAVVEVTLSTGSGPVAKATVTYSIPV